jgi:hypothetical protein
MQLLYLPVAIIMALAGMKRKIEDILLKVSDLCDEINNEIQRASDEHTNNTELLTASEQKELTRLREATMEGKTIKTTAPLKGKWDNNTFQRKCHGQWLDASTFDSVQQNSVWDRRSWKNLDAVSFLTQRDGEIPHTVLLCAACCHKCPACCDIALVSDLHKHGICKQCGDKRTELALRER